MVLAGVGEYAEPACGVYLDAHRVPRDDFYGHRVRISMAYDSALAVPVPC